MRLSLKAAMLTAAAMVIPAAPAPVQGAGLGVEPAKTVRLHHKRARVVADYDGTPVIVHRSKVVRTDWYGNPVVEVRTVHQPVIGYPTRYFNGQPVRSAYLIRYRPVW